MKEKIEQIIDRNTEGNYLLSSTDKAQMVSEILNLVGATGSLPTSEELQEIVVKIAYSQQGEEQADDCYAKMGMLYEFMSKYVNGNDRQRWTACRSLAISELKTFNKH